MTRIFAFFLIIALFFLLEGGFFVQNSALSSYNFLFSKTTENPQVIFGGGYLFSDVLYLNRGSEDGAEVGDLIIYGQNIAIGKVGEVFGKFSKIIPLSKFGEKNSFRLGEEKRVLFEGVGAGGGKISADFPNSVFLNAGEEVYFAQNPKYLAGIVEEVDKKQGRDFKMISIRIPVSLNSITDVALIKNNAPQR